MKKIFPLLLFVLTAFGVQAQKKKCVIIRVVLAEKGCMQDPVIHITEVDGTTRDVALDPYRSQKFAVDNTANDKKIQEVLNTYLARDFALQSNTMVHSNDCLMLTTFVLVK